MTTTELHIDFPLGLLGGFPPNPFIDTGESNLSLAHDRQVLCYWALPSALFTFKGILGSKKWSTLKKINLNVYLICEPGSLRLRRVSSVLFCNVGISICRPEKAKENKDERVGEREGKGEIDFGFKNKPDWLIDWLIPGLKIDQLRELRGYQLACVQMYLLIRILHFLGGRESQFGSVEPHWLNGTDSMVRGRPAC